MKKIISIKPIKEYKFKLIIRALKNSKKHKLINGMLLQNKLINFKKLKFNQDKEQYLF